MSTELTAKLESDIAFLHGILSGVIRQREGDAFFSTLSDVLKLSDSYRDSRSGTDFSALARIVSALGSGDAEKLTRALSCYLTLVNIAEEHHKVRLNRVQGFDSTAAALADTFRDLLKGGLSAERLYDSVSQLSIDLVLTAHPTEIMRRGLLQKYTNLSRALEVRDYQNLSPFEKSDNDDAIRREIFGIWETDAIRKKKPTPTDEAYGGLLVFEQTLGTSCLFTCANFPSRSKRPPAGRCL